MMVTLRQIARDPRVYERLSKDIIAPEIWGREDIKKAVAAQLFGGVRQILPDGIKLRGDIHVLLLGYATITMRHCASPVTCSIDIMCLTCDR